MRDIQEMYRGFAGPQQQLDENFMELVAVEYAREVIRTFLDRFSESLDCQGLASFIASSLALELTFPKVWDPAIGLAQNALVSHDPSDYLRAAATLALLLHRAGQAGAWKVRFDTPLRLRWGRWVLPKAEDLQVKADSGHITFWTRLEGNTAQVAFFHSGQEWEPEQPASLLQLPQLDLGDGKLIFLLEEVLEDQDFDFLRPILQREAPATRIKEAFEPCITLLRSHAPEYLRWVSRVLRFVIPLQAYNGRIESGSSFSHAGMSHLSLDPRPAALAEMLVHEASHQYFYLLRRLGATDDGSDSTLYYSPITGLQRPLWIVLLAYHAFANVVLLYRRLQAEGSDDGGYCLTKEKTLVSQLQYFERILASTKALTPLGQALWEPLVERIKREQD